MVGGFPKNAEMRAEWRSSITERDPRPTAQWWRLTLAAGAIPATTMARVCGLWDGIPQRETPAGVLEIVKPPNETAAMTRP